MECPRTLQDVLEFQPRPESVRLAVRPRTEQREERLRFSLADLQPVERFAVGRSLELPVGTVRLANS